MRALRGTHRRVEEEDYDRIFADAWKRLIATMPGRAIREIASADHDAKGERLKQFLQRSSTNGGAVSWRKRRKRQNRCGAVASSVCDGARPG